MVAFLIIISIVCGIFWLKSIDKGGNTTKDTKYFGWICLIAAGLALYVYSENDKKSKMEHTSHSEKIHFGGNISSHYTFLYTLPAYDGNGVKVCDVDIKSNSDGKLFAFPNGSSSPQEFWDAPYDSPGTYSCTWGGMYIYF